MNHDEESVAIGWISITDLLMVGTLSMLLVTRGLELESQEKATAIETLESNLEALTDSSDGSNGDWRSFAARLNEAKEQLGRTQTELAGQERNLKKLFSERDELAARVAATAMKEAQAQERLKMVEATVRNLEQSLAAAHAKFAESEGQVTKLSEKSSSTAMKEAQVQQRLKVAESTVSELEQSLVAAQAKIADGEAKVIKLSEKLSLTSIKERGVRQELLGIRAKGDRFKRVVFVVDKSGSMGGQSQREGMPRWQYVKGIIESWVMLLPYEEVQIVTFGDESEVFPAKGEFVSLGETEESRAEATTSLVAVLSAPSSTKAKTNTSAALRDAFQIKEDGETFLQKEVDAIFLFTDGQPTKGESSILTVRAFQDEVLDLVDSKLRPDGVPINVIGLGDYLSPPSEIPGEKKQAAMPFGEFLVKIAEKSGGAFLGR